MPSFPKPIGAIKRQCWECHYYELGTPSGAYCNFHKAVFPNQWDWAIPGKTGTKAGLRTCKHWKIKKVKIMEFEPELIVKKMMERRAEREKINDERDNNSRKKIVGGGHGASNFRLSKKE